MLELRPLQQGDIEEVRKNPLEEAVKRYPDLPTPDNNAFSGFWDGELIGVGGVIILWEGVGELWLILSKDFIGISDIATFMAIRKKINELIANNNLWRVQAIVRDDFPKAIKMIEALGFHSEGLLERYCPDKGDAIIYSRVL